MGAALRKPQIWGFINKIALESGFAPCRSSAVKIVNFGRGPVLRVDGSRTVRRHQFPLPSNSANNKHSTATSTNRFSGCSPSGEEGGASPLWATVMGSCHSSVTLAPTAPLFRLLLLLGTINGKEFPRVRGVTSCPCPSAPGMPSRCPSITTPHQRPSPTGTS